MVIKEIFPEQFSELESYWKKLEKGCDMTGFQFYDWYKNVNDLYFKEKVKNIFRKWVYLLVLEDERPIMIAPIQVVKVGFGNKNYGISKGFYLIGRHGYTDYLNFVYDEFCPDAVELIFEHLVNKYKLNLCRFEQIIENTAFSSYIQARYAVDKRGVYCAALVLPDTFDEYKKSLSKSSRQNIRTAINRQVKDDLIFEHKMIYSYDEELVKNLYNIRAQRLKEKNLNALKSASFLGKIYNKLCEFISKVFSAEHDVINNSCNSWCFLVNEGENVASFFWGIRNDYKNEYYVVLAGVDKKYLRYTPSLSHLYLFIEEQYDKNENNVKVFDFTRGTERYKTDIGGAKKEVYSMDFVI